MSILTILSTGPNILLLLYNFLSGLIILGLLRAVSRAVDLIMAHFGSSRDPEEKMRLGNSSRSPTIAGLVLEHLCPTIQNILEDGLRDHKLDLIIGQRRNHSWRVVEVSTRIGITKF
uniref:RUN domain-containing protein n=1 Tax=Sphaeramia orbicularis TaxID=375764 RepID=A0A673A8B8_9TELE